MSAVATPGRCTVSYKQIENSARPAEVKGNATNSSDLDDRLINQALDIMLNSRKNAVDNSSLSNRANCVGSAIANELNKSLDQVTNRLASPRSNQAELGTTTTNTVKELLNNAKEHSRGSASPSSEIEQKNSIRNAILNNLLDGTCERGPVIRNGRSDRAVIHENPSASASDVIRAAAEGAVAGAMAGGAAARVGRAAAEGAVKGAIIAGAGTEFGRAAAEGAIGGAVGSAAARIGRAITEAGKNFESLPPVKNRSSREESDNQEGAGEKSIQNQLPKSIKDILREELKMPSEIFACVYRPPVEIRLDDEKGGIIKSPRDIIACAERIPKTGGKPEAGNYFACVHYYPLQTTEIRSREKTD